MKGVGVVWLSPKPSGGTTSQGPVSTGPVWHIWSDGACYLLSGPGEQPLPGIVHGGCCTVTARNSGGGRAITWTATVQALEPESEQWATIAPKLAAGRLNGGDPATVVLTWPGRLSIMCLRPTGEQDTAGSGLPDDSGATAPLPSPATTPYRMPSNLTRGLPRPWPRRRTERRRKPAR